MTVPVTVMRRSAMTLAVSALVAGAFAVGYDVAGRGGTTGGPVSVGGHPLKLVNDDLTTGTCEDLRAWYAREGVARVTAWGWTSPIYYAEDSAAGAPVAGGTRTSSGAEPAKTPQAASSATGTNVQEAGVDEPDVAKTDGRLLVQAHDGHLTVWDVSGQHPRRLGDLALTGMSDAQVLLAHGVATVIGTDATGGTVPEPVSAGTRVLTVDLSDPSSPSVTHTDVYDGSLVSASLTGGAVRLVLSAPLPDLDFVQPGALRSDSSALEHNQQVVRDAPIDAWLPHVTSYDGTDAGGAKPEPLLACDRVAIPSYDSGLGTVAIVGFDAGHPADRVSTAVTTPSTIAYTSPDRLYLATSAGPVWGCCVSPDTAVSSDDGTTHLYAFRLSGRDATYLASGQVAGQVTDRWSMDEQHGVLRVAVTPTSRTGSFTSVVTLARQGSDLVELGRVDGLGRGETLQSVRWFDSMALVVTYQQVDPLYAVSLTDPRHPRLLGQLTLPGFSTYLHPIGRHQVIGIGQDEGQMFVPPEPPVVPYPTPQPGLPTPKPSDVPSTVPAPEGSATPMPGPLPGPDSGSGPGSGSQPGDPGEVPPSGRVSGTPLPVDPLPGDIAPSPRPDDPSPTIDPKVVVRPGGAKAALFDLRDVTHPRQTSLVRYRPGTTALAGQDPRQFTWLPGSRTALTVVGNGSTAWVSVLRVRDGHLTSRLVPAAYGTDTSQVRLVPLPDGRVLLVTPLRVRFLGL